MNEKILIGTWLKSLDSSVYSVFVLSSTALGGDLQDADEERQESLQPRADEERRQGEKRGSSLPAAETNHQVATVPL